MKITNLKTNHLTNPVGYQMSAPVISFTVTDCKGSKLNGVCLQVSLSEDFNELIYDSGRRDDISPTGYVLPIELSPRTRYFWRVQCWSDAEGESALSQAQYFETPKGDSWDADWITPCADKALQIYVEKSFDIAKPVASARMYMVGLGVYELYLNGEKQGDECLLPGFSSYDRWLQYQTFPLSLKEGTNKISVMLGDGWYKGWYGLDVKEENYGDRLACIGELYITYQDGTEEKILTDTSWTARRSPVSYSGIYPGEIYDPAIDQTYKDEKIPVEVIDLDKGLLEARLNPPILIQDRIKPIEVIHTPAGETVLDMGQNMVGWFEFKCKAPAGKKLFFQFGEIMQDSCFYNDNLRTAKAEFTYISDGQERMVRQHFTFYGFRFVNVVGWDGEIDLNDFTGLVIHSQMDEIGYIETGDPLVNQLIHNAKWGQKGNFLDVPTDCPQRDERYGWTGDAQVFSGTACYNMDTYAFYRKFGRDLYEEQKKLGGRVPDVVPMANYSENSSSSTAWGDAATIIPWNVYLHYGDPQILIDQFDSMKAWVDFIRREDEANKNNYLWQGGWHYGDWLALDGDFPGGVFGATDPDLIASAYYYYSANITAKAARVIGSDEAAYYKDLAANIKEAFINEYFTPAGNLSVDTTTAYVVCLYMDLTPDFAYEKVKRGLFKRLKRNKYHLDTGFVGTPYLCRVLSENGMNDQAYHLLMEKGYPGWLYEVIMGATTVWERWNSVLPDGKISGTDMNSLNHYAYGSIVEWMYRNMAGIQPCEDGPGFKKFIIKPAPNYHIPWINASLMSPYGEIRSEWEIIEADGEAPQQLSFTFEVPFDTRAEIYMPHARLEDIAGYAEGAIALDQGQDYVYMVIPAGIWSFTYQPTVAYRKIYSIDSPVEDLVKVGPIRDLLSVRFPVAVSEMPFKEQMYTLRDMMNGPFANLPHQEQAEIDEIIRKIQA